MLCYSLFKPSTEKRQVLIQKVPKHLPVWRHSARYFDHVSVSFLRNKENEQEFLPSEKNLIYLSFLRNTFYFLVFLCFFIIPFLTSILDFLLLLIVDPCHTVSRLLMTTVRGVSKRRRIFILTVCLVLLVPGYQRVRSDSWHMGSCRQTQIIYTQRQ